MDNFTRQLVFMKGYKKAVDDYTKMVQDYAGDNVDNKELKFLSESIKNRLITRLERSNE